MKASDASASALFSGASHKLLTSDMYPICVEKNSRSAPLFDACKFGDFRMARNTSSPAHQSIHIVILMVVRASAKGSLL